MNRLLVEAVLRTAGILIGAARMFSAVRRNQPKTFWATSLGLMSGRLYSVSLTLRRVAPSVLKRSLCSNNRRVTTPGFEDVWRRIASHRVDVVRNFRRLTSRVNRGRKLNSCSCEERALAISSPSIASLFVKPSLVKFCVVMSKAEVRVLKDVDMKGIP